MIDVFIDQCTAGIDEREMSYLHEKITSTLKFGSGFASKRVTKMAINAAISEAIYSLILTKEIMKPISRGVGNVAMFGLGSYGIIEKAAQAKERLRMQSPIYYWSLYFMKIEMLYFIVEDNLSCGLHLISQYKNKVNDVYDAFMKILYG